MNSNHGLRSVLIFGGAGFIGCNWAHRLLEKTDAKLHIFDNLSRQGVRHNLEALQEKAGGAGRLQVTVGDIRDFGMVARAVRQATEIYHFAAQVAVTTSVADPRTDFEINLGGTFNILEAARRSGHQPFLLFTSTNKVYGDMGAPASLAGPRRYHCAGTKGVSELQPLDFHSPYGCSKGSAEQYVRDYARMFHIPSVVLRMSCIAGPRQFGNEDQGWVAHFLYAALQKMPVVIYGDGRQVRDVLCVDDLLRAFEALRDALPQTAGQIYNIGGGPQNTTSLLELLPEIERITGQRVRYLLGQRRPGDQLVYITDFAKLRRDTGWQPEISLRQTLEKMHDWWKRNRSLFEPVAVAERTASAILQELPGTAA